VVAVPIADEYTDACVQPRGKKQLMHLYLKRQTCCVPPR